jgi:hypothetical protein
VCTCLERQTKTVGRAVVLPLVRASRYVLSCSIATANRCAATVPHRKRRMLRLEKRCARFRLKQSVSFQRFQPLVRTTPKGGQWVVTGRTTGREWAGRFSWRGVPTRGDANGTTGDCLELMVLISMVLTVVLMIGGNEQIPGPVVEVKNTVRLLLTGCGRNLKSGIQYELCGRWIIVAEA